MRDHASQDVTSWLTAVLCLLGALTFASADVTCDVDGGPRHRLRVTCRDRHMTSLPVMWPPGQIVSLSARSANVSNVTSLSHPRLSRLRKLDLENNNLHHLPAAAFRSLAQLRFLNLDHNYLTSVPEKAFGHLSALKILSLRHNELEIVPNKAFNGLFNLRSLHLDYNALTLVFPDAFEGLTNLTYLSLSHNSLAYSSLPQGLFAPLHSLQNLRLEYNDYGLDGEYPSKVFDSLTKLKLFSVDTYSSVHFGKDFAAMHELYELDFSHNCKLRTLLNDSFEGFKNSSVEVIRLDWCPLQRVDACALHCGFPRLHSLSLAHGRLLPANLAAVVLNGLRRQIVYSTEITMSSAPPSTSETSTPFSFTFFNIRCLTSSIPERKDLGIERYSHALDTTAAFTCSHDVFINCSEQFDTEFIIPDTQFTMVYLDTPYTVLQANPFQDGPCQATVEMTVDSYRPLVPFYYNPRSPSSMLHIAVDHQLTSLNLSETLRRLSPSGLPDYVSFSSAQNVTLLNISHLQWPVCRTKFVGFKVLLSLDMSGNDCYSITDNIWDHLGSSLQQLYFTRMSLNSRMFTHFSGRLFRRLSRLEYLDLSHNMLRDFNLSILSNSRLRELRLSANRLSSLSGLDTGSFVNLSFLDLSFNSISSIPLSDMQALDRLASRHPLSLRLGGNPLLCSCSTHQFVSWILTSNVTFDDGGTHPPGYQCTTDWGETMRVGQFCDVYSESCVNGQDKDKVYLVTSSGPDSVLVLDPLCVFLVNAFTLSLLSMALVFLVVDGLGLLKQLRLIRERKVSVVTHLPMPSAITNDPPAGTQVCVAGGLPNASYSNSHGKFSTPRTPQKDEIIDENAHPLPCVCKKWQKMSAISAEGGVLRLAGSDVTLRIPPDAVEGRVTVNVQSAVCAGTDHLHRVLGLPAQDIIVSPLAEYWAGHHVVFQRPVCISLPHCLPPRPDLDLVKVYRVSPGHDGNLKLTRVPLRRPRPEGTSTVKRGHYTDQRTAESLSDMGSNGTDVSAGVVRSHTTDTHEDESIPAQSNQRVSSSSTAVDETEVALEECASFQLTEEGTVLVYTDRFSAYVCVYCGVRQGPLTLKVMVCGRHQQKSSGQHTAHISAHIWDRRLDVRDFREEYGVSDPDEVLATMVVNLLDEFQGSYLYVHLETLGQEADQWQPCRRRDGRPATPVVQQHPFSDVVTCDNDDCDVRQVWSRPVTSHWVLESCPESRPGSLLQCVLDVSHVAVDVTPQWSDRHGHERITTLPIQCHLEERQPRPDCPRNQVDNRLSNGPPVDRGILCGHLMRLSVGQLEDLARTLGMPDRHVHDMRCRQSGDELRKALIVLCLQQDPGSQLLPATLSVLSDHRHMPGAGDLGIASCRHAEDTRNLGRASSRHAPDARDLGRVSSHHAPDARDSGTVRPSNPRADAGSHPQLQGSEPYHIMPSLGALSGFTFPSLSSHPSEARFGEPQRSNRDSSWGIQRPFGHAQPTTGAEACPPGGDGGGTIRGRPPFLESDTAHGSSSRLDVSRRRPTQHSDYTEYRTLLSLATSALPGNQLQQPRQFYEPRVAQNALFPDFEPRPEGGQQWPWVLVSDLPAAMNGREPEDRTLHPQTSQQQALAVVENREGEDDQDLLNVENGSGHSM